MAERGRPRTLTDEERQRRNTVLLTLKPEAITAFNVLKAEQGPRSGPRLAAEAIDLLLILYGKPPIEQEHLGWIAARQQEPAPSALTTAGSMRPGFVAVPVSKAAKKKG